MSSAENGPAMTADHVKAARLSARHHADEAAEAEWSLNNFLLRGEDRADAEALSKSGVIMARILAEVATYIEAQIEAIATEGHTS